MLPISPKDLAKITMKFMEPYPYREPFISYGLAGVPHKGIDFGRKSKETAYIIAPVSGRIKLVDKWDPPPIGTSAFNAYINKHPFGNLVVIESSESDKGFLHYLAHLYKVFVTVGQIVTKGAVIGIMGTTGKSTGIHLHYGVKNLQGKWVDPMPYCS